MIRFQVFHEGRAATSWPLRNAYLIGVDGNPLRAEIYFEKGQIVCETREPTSVALALQHRVGELGELTIQSCLLPQRDEPYLLALELARHRLMILYAKLEDWGMFELGSEHAVTKRCQRARKAFIDALCVQHEDPAGAWRMAQESLASALDGSEELALAHSLILLNRRKETASLPEAPVGCGVHLDQGRQPSLLGQFDFLQIPTPWKRLAPEEGEYQWQAMDRWIEWAREQRKAVVAGPLINFEPTNLPDWLYIWEHDYDTVRDLIYEHVEQVVGRYREGVDAWNVVSGLHVNEHFTFNFEQLMDLTRMTAMLVKKLAPAARALIEIRQPFGEYYGRNQRSIPPMMYADLVSQSAVNFDAFALRLPMGQALPGQYTRDLMQISALLDQYAVFGKPIYLTVAAPSEPVTSMMIAAPASGEPVDANSGFWRRPWSPQVQSHWLEAVFQIAMSRPFVEAVAWQDLSDHPQIELPLAGLVSEQAQPKGALARLLNFRKSLMESNGQGAGTGAGDASTAPGAAVPGITAAGAATGQATRPDPG